MAHFEWDPGLETGNENIDSQHRELFALANKLHSAVDSCEPGDEIVADAVYGLVDYCVEHFSDEELLMSEAAYPELAPHAGIHETLKFRVTGMVARYFNGDDIMPDEVAPFVITWLTDHIGQVDRRFVDFLRRESQ